MRRVDDLKNRKKLDAKTPANVQTAADNIRGDTAEAVKVGTAIVPEKLVCKAVEDIVLAQLDGLNKNSDRHEYILQRVFMRALFTNSRMETIDLPPNTYRCTADIKVINRDGQNWHLETMEFMLFEGTLLPLKTHVRERKNTFPVYKFSSDFKSYESEQTIADYIMEKLPNDIILTRVLSDEEAQKYEQGREDLGSPGNMFWGKGIIHTALHNVSSEFINKQSYPKVIKFKISKEKLKELLQSSAAEIGTYGWVFLDRDQNSPFPFEAEVVFNPEAKQALVDGYNRWKAEDGGSIQDNPFANY